MAGQHFRAGVVIAVHDRQHRRLLAFERADQPGSWQLPQGGLDTGESPLAAAWRELHEETGLTADDVEVVGEHPEWIAYEWPAEVQAIKGRDGQRLGQVQRWWFFAARADDLQPSPDGSEFINWRWVEAAWLIDHVPEFRRHAYRRVLGSTAER